jgi:hypothetical protein
VRWTLLPLAMFLSVSCAEPRLPFENTVGLRFEGEPKNARVTIDEIAIGSLEDVIQRGVRVAEGPHQVSIVAQGYFPQDSVVIAQGSTTKVAVKLRKLPE